MAIESLMVPQAAPTVDRFRGDSVDIIEAVDVTLEAYTLLGYAGDPENARKDLTDAFDTNAGLGLAGRLFVRAHKAIPFSTLLDAVDGKRPEGVYKAYVYPNLWTPGTEKESYTEEELNEGPAKPLARLALFNTSPARDGEIDPILHYTGLPYDEYAKERWGGGATTQLAEMEEDKETFERDHSDFILAAADHRDFAVLALMDRIRGVKPQDQILARGFMRIQEPGRRTVGGDSYVGGVGSSGGQLLFGGSNGDALPDGGLGVVVGPKELTT